jgi:hypothetical protein
MDGGVDDGAAGEGFGVKLMAPEFMLWFRANYRHAVRDVDVIDVIELSEAYSMMDASARSLAAQRLQQGGRLEDAARDIFREIVV